MRHIKTIGIDLAKNVFQLHAVDSKGKKIFAKRIGRQALKELMVTMPRCTVAIEACTGAHYWARLLKSYGHEIKMISPQFVKPYVRGSKNDKNDSQAIVRASSDPDMKYVPIKTIEQQEMQMLHRTRELLIKQRTAQSNQLRGFLAEFGIVTVQGLSATHQLPKLVDEHNGLLSTRGKQMFMRMYEHFNYLDKEVNEYDKQIQNMAKTDVRCVELMKLEGVGPLVSTIVVSTLGDGHAFKNGREAAAYLGLVPKQFSSGNKIYLGGITKRGDRYARKSIIQGARSVVKVSDKKSDRKSQWVSKIKEKGGFNKASVALANKQVRIMWAILRTGECYRSTQADELLKKVV